MKMDLFIIVFPFLSSHNIRKFKTIHNVKFRNVSNITDSKRIDLICANGEIWSGYSSEKNDSDLELFRITNGYSNVSTTSSFSGCTFYLLSNGDLYVYSIDFRNVIFLASSISFIHDNLCVNSQGRLYEYNYSIDRCWPKKVRQKVSTEATYLLFLALLTWFQ